MYFHTHTKQIEISNANTLQHDSACLYIPSECFSSQSDRIKSPSKYPVPNVKTDQCSHFEWEFSQTAEKLRFDA